MIKELQKEYDDVLNEIKTINAKKKEILNKISKNGLAVFKDEIKEDEKVYGIFYDLDFYSHFDGHASEAVYYYQSGASEISNEDFKLLKRLITEFKEDTNGSIEDRNSKYINILCEEFISFLPDYFYNVEEDMFNFFEIVNDNNIKWTYKGNNNQSELSDGSNIVFKKSTKSTIKAVKKVDR